MILGRRGSRSISLLLVGLGVVSILALLVSPCAFADEWDDEEGGFVFEGASYISLGFSYVEEEVTRQIGQSSTDKGFHIVDAEVKNAEGINAIFGRRALEYLAVELQFEYVDGFHFFDTDGDYFELKVYTTTLNAKVFPLHDLLRNVNEGRIQPHLLGGFGIMATNDLDIDTGAAMAFRAGGGVDYFINENWALTLKSSYVYPFGQLKGLRFITSSIGFSYQLE
jgi:opacity protein-like surface antigen